MTGAPWDLFPDLAGRAAAAIHLAMPDLRTCTTRAGAMVAGDVDKLGAASPAVVVSWLEARPAVERTGPQPSFDLGLAAYVITKDRMGVDRETAAAAIAARIMALVPTRTWGRREAGEATGVRLQSLVSAALREKGIALWAVTWTQPLVLEIEGDLGAMPREVYAPVDPTEDDASIAGGQPSELVSEVPE